MTSRGHLYAEFKRALDRGNVWVAEAAARDLPQVSLEDALQLVHLYGERGSPKFERAALRHRPPPLPAPHRHVVDDGERPE